MTSAARSAARFPQRGSTSTWRVHLLSPVTHHEQADHGLPDLSHLKATTKNTSLLRLFGTSKPIARRYSSPRLQLHHMRSIAMATAIPHPLPWLQHDETVHHVQGSEWKRISRALLPMTQTSR